jgi:cytochrome P450
MPEEDAMTATAPAQSAPWLAPRAAGARHFFRAARQNLLSMWPEEAYSDWVDTRRLVGRSRILINAPEAIRHVLVDNTDNYRRSRATIRILRPITGDGLLLSRGDAWRHQRRTIAPALAPRALPVLSHHIAAAAGEAVASLQAGAGGPVDLLAAMQHLALEIAGRTMFSLEMGAHGTAMREMLARYALRNAPPDVLDLLLPRWMISPRDIGRIRFRREWTRFIDRLVAGRSAAAAEEDGAPRDLFDMLRRARDPETGAAFSPAILRDEVATMIVAGHETTAMTLFWSLTLLADAPEQQETLAAEVAGLDLSPDAAAATMPRLVRTRAVVSEALRLYPPAPLIVREAIGPDRAGEVAVPAGALMMIAPWVLHRHRMLWREPEAFDPSRFLPGAPEVPRFAYLPFGVGPRVCVGAQFALTEATLVLAAMIRAFHVARVSTRPVLPMAVVTLQPDHPPVFVLRPR